jgi:hypothetical protein
MRWTTVVHNFGPGRAADLLLYDGFEEDRRPVPPDPPPHRPAVTTPFTTRPGRGHMPITVLP